MFVSTVAQEQGPTPREKVSAEEWETRVQLAAAYRLTEMMGWQSTIIYNHISARVPGDDHHILLNPLGLRYDEVTASNLVKLDLDGNILDDTPYGINQAGYTIHSAIHAARSDVVCAFHTHTEDGTAVSSLEEGLMFTNQEVLMFHGNLAYHEFEGIALDLDERERLVADMGDKKVLILKNHGLLTTGRTIGEAFTFMYFLEKACSTQLKMMASGGKVIPISENVIGHTVGQYNLSEKVCGAQEWAALVRKLDAVDTSYQH